MNAELIVKRANQLGITLILAGDKIKYSPMSRTPEDFIRELREHKPEILLYLSETTENVIPEDKDLLAWASHLAEENITLNEPIRYNESELIPVNTTRISFYAGKYLTTIAYTKCSSNRWIGKMGTPMVPGTRRGNVKSPRKFTTSFISKGREK